MKRQNREELIEKCDDRKTLAKALIRTNEALDSGNLLSARVNFDKILDYFGLETSLADKLKGVVK